MRLNTTIYQNGGAKFSGVNQEKLLKNFLCEVKKFI